MTDLSEKLANLEKDADRIISGSWAESHESNCARRIFALIDALEHARNVARAHGVTTLDAEAFDAEILRCLEGK